MDAKNTQPPLSSENEEETKIIQETLQLLSFVTYVRVVIENVAWEVPPKFVKEEAKRQRSPRHKGQIYLIYQIPALSRLTPRGSSKPVKVLAKEVSSRYVNFYDKHVTLCRITSSVVDCWANSQCEFKLYYCPPKKNMGILFAKCVIPLSKILVLPFYFDSSVPLEMVNELSHCRGKLKISVQLGSRMQQFLERIEPMRNPTTSVSPITFLDPDRVKSPDGEEFGNKESNTDAEFCRCTAESERKSEKGEKEGYIDDSPSQARLFRRSRQFSPLSFTRSYGRQSQTSAVDETFDVPTKPEPHFSLSNDVRWKRNHVGADDYNIPRSSSRVGAFLQAEERPPEPLDVAPYSRPAPEIETLSIWRQAGADGFGFSGVSANIISLLDSYKDLNKDKRRKKERQEHEKRESSTSAPSYTEHRESRRKSTVAEWLKTNVPEPKENIPQRMHCVDRFSNLMDDKGVNTSLLIAANNADDFDVRQNASDLFVDLTSRSYLSKKLKNNIDELTELINKLKNRGSS